MVTHNDLLDALRAHMLQTGDGFTCPELAAQMGCGVQRIQVALKVMLAEGKAEVVSLRRERMNGVMTLVRGYRLKAA